MDPLRQLALKVFFANSWNPGQGPSVLPQYERLAKQECGRVVDEGAVYGIKVHEGTFEDSTRRGQLPCGARTLYLAKTGEVWLRGMDKFPDYEAVAGLLVRPDLRRVVQPSFHQRKLAGFLVVVAAPEGELVVSSKHTLSGEHAALASRWLTSHCPNLSRLTGMLAAHKAALLCEAVMRDEDTWHPVHEDSAFEGLTPFALIRRDTLVETPLPQSLLVSVCEAAGLTPLPSVPCDWEAFDRLVRSAWCYGEGGETEGWVVTFDFPALDTVLGNDAPHHLTFRIKVKTLQYKMRRHLRHILTSWGGDPSALVSLWPSLPPYDKAVVAWMSAAKPTIPFGNVVGVVTAFERSLGQKARGEWMSFLQSLRPPALPDTHTLVVAVGLPGTGKSTILRNAAHALAEQVFYISRDTLTVQERARRGVTARADVSRGVHRRVGRLLRLIAQQATTPSVVVVDGCHLTQGARNMVAKGFSNVLFINFRCPVNQLLDRIRSRKNHPTLPPEHADTVVALMQPRVQYETQHSLDVDTTLPLSDLVPRVVQAITQLHKATGLAIEGVNRVVDTPIIEAELRMDDSLLPALGLQAPVITKVCDLQLVAVESQGRWRSAAEGVLTGLVRGMGDGEAECCRLQSGSLRWLEGTLRKHQAKHGGTLSDALVEHYGITLDTLHCTVAFLAGQLPSARTAEMLTPLLEDIPKWKRAKCTVVADRLLCDNKGICLDVSRIEAHVPTEGFLGWLGVSRTSHVLYERGVEEAESPHVTLGVVEKETAKYCATLRSSINGWEEENVAFRQERAHKRMKLEGTQEETKTDETAAAVPRKRRQHNFVVLEIHPPLALPGGLAFHARE
eukprot:Sspe_Gene.60154::Locus_33117_Transcript_1_1_Confidence_1.000_Length_2588::g.60154::m.60154